MADGVFDFASNLYADAPTIDAPNINFPQPTFSIDPAMAGVGTGVVPQGEGMPGAPAPPPSQPGFVSQMGTKLADQFTGDPLGSFVKTLGLGATGFNIGNQINTAGQLNQATKSVQQGQKQAQAAAAPAVAFGQSTLQSAQAGQLPQPMQDAVTQWTQQAKSAIRAQYAQMGLGNSSDIASEEKKIDLMAQSMIAELLQQQEQTALTGLQTGVQAATGGAQLGQQQQTLLTNLIAQANQQLGKLGASG